MAESYSVHIPAVSSYGVCVCVELKPDSDTHQSEPQCASWFSCCCGPEQAVAEEEEEDEPVRKNRTQEENRVQVGTGFRQELGGFLSPFGFTLMAPAVVELLLRLFWAATQLSDPLTCRSKKITAELHLKVAASYLKSDCFCKSTTKTRIKS